MKTYKQQFDKLTEAYINNKVMPLQNCACFVGNLLGGTTAWGNVREFDMTADNAMMISRKKFDMSFSGMIGYLTIHNSGYTVEDIIRLEQAFIGTINHDNIFYRIYFPNLEQNLQSLPDYEDRLFRAFEVTLDVLKQIHIEHGEKVDAGPVFQKRQKPVCI